MNFYLRVGSVNINTHFMNAVKHICMYNFVMDRVPRYAYNKGLINFGTSYSSLFPAPLCIFGTLYDCRGEMDADK
jgi:hypothetical protein